MARCATLRSPASRVTLALIDGDIVAFRAAAAHAKTFDFGDGVIGEQNDFAGAAAAAVDTIASWARIARCKDVLVCFTGPHNFRKVILPSYKANRVKGKPPTYVHTVEAVHERFTTRVVDGLEADDLLGILATTDKYADSIILTADKDLRTVPGRHFNPIKETHPVVVSEAEGNHFWMLQSLMGDVTDGYTGIPGVGIKKAEKLLGPVGQTEAGLWRRVVEAYRAAKLTERDALTQARVARILRRCDYDKSTKEILLWHPSKAEPLTLATVCAA